MRTERGKEEELGYRMKMTGLNGRKEGGCR